MIARTDHKLVRVSLRLANRPSLGLVGAVTRNRWWVSLKHRIRDFATKYGRQFNLDKIREAKSIEDRRWLGDSLTVELARRDLASATRDS